MITFNLILVIVIVTLTSNVAGHGMLLDPPGRSSMWRAGFPTPTNYNDNSLFCGGFSVSNIIYLLYTVYKSHNFSNFTFSKHRFSITKLIKDDVVNAETNGVYRVQDLMTKEVFTVRESSARLINKAA